MKKLNKTQLKRRDAIGTAINDAHATLAVAIGKYNAQLLSMQQEVDGAVEEYNEALSQARDFRDEVVSEMEDYAGDKSEKWTDSDAGTAFSDWKSEWEQVELEDVEVEYPDEIEVPDNHQETFEALPEEASS